MGQKNRCLFFSPAITTEPVTKQFLACILSLAVVLSLSVSAFAADTSVPTDCNESLSDAHLI